MDLENRKARGGKIPGFGDSGGTRIILKPHSFKFERFRTSVRGNMSVEEERAVISANSRDGEY